MKNVARFLLDSLLKVSKSNSTYAKRRYSFSEFRNSKAFVCLAIAVGSFKRIPTIQKSYQLYQYTNNKV